MIRADVFFWIIIHFKSSTMKNYVVRYGLYAGMTLIVLGLFNWFVIAPNGYQVSQAFGYLSMVIALFTVPMAIKYFRDKLNDGFVSFGKGMKIGMGVTSITSLVMGIYSALFFYLQGDQFMEWSKQQLSAEEWAEAEAYMETMGSIAMSPLFQGFIMFLTVFFIGAIITLISALVLKRD